MAWRPIVALAFLLSAAPAPQRDPYLVLGQRQVSEGNFEEAVFSLDTAVRRLSGKPDRTSELVDAYAYLGAAYVSLENENAARGKFREALRLEGALRLNPEQFPPRVLKVFDEVRIETSAASRKRSARTWLILGGVGAAGAVGAGAAFGGHAPSNRPPTGSIGMALEGQAITGVTNVDFSATASDRDGDSLTFSWNFGDGNTAIGQNVSHVFAREGTLTVTLTVSDGRGGSGTSTATVTARSLNGVWRSADCCADGSRNDFSDFQCVQSGGSIDCQRVSSTGNPNSERWVGSLASPRSIDVQVFLAGGRPSDRCRGELLTSLDCFRCVGSSGGVGGLYRASVGQCR